MEPNFQYNTGQRIVVQGPDGLRYGEIERQIDDGRRNLYGVQFDDRAKGQLEKVDEEHVLRKENIHEKVSHMSREQLENATKNLLKDIKAEPGKESFNLPEHMQHTSQEER